MATKFTTWLNQELNGRGWSIRELARRAELSHATINSVLTENSNPGPDLCNGLARALKVPPERVFRLAGLLPPRIIGHNDNTQESELLEYYRALDPATRDTVLTTTRALYESRAAYDSGDTNETT